MLFFIPVTWLVFAISDFNQLAIYLGDYFLLNTTVANVFELDYVKYGNIYGKFLVIGLMFCTKLPQKIYKKIKIISLELFYY